MHGFPLVPPRATPVPTLSPGAFQALSPAHAQSWPLAPTLAERDRDGTGPPGCPGREGDAAPPGMLLAQAVGRAHPCTPGVRLPGVAAVSPDGECQADWHCRPRASPPGYRGPGTPLPYLPAGGDEVRLAGGTGLLHLHNNLVNGAWPAGEPGWRHHPLPAPPPPSGPAAPPAAARGAERSAGCAAGRWRGAGQPPAAS